MSKLPGNPYVDLMKEKGNSEHHYSEDTNASLALAYEIRTLSLALLSKDGYNSSHQVKTSEVSERLGKR